MNDIIVKFNNLKIRRWMKGKEIHVIDSKSIRESFKVHKEFDTDLSYLLGLFKNKEIVARNIVVKKNKNGYSLIMGVRWLRVAKALKKPITCVVIESNSKREDIINEIGIVEGDIMLPEGTQRIYSVDEINISERFKSRHPKKEKIEDSEKYFKDNKTISKPITINKKKRILIDGYVRFLTLKSNGIKHIPVCFEIDKINNNKGRKIKNAEQ